MSPKSTGSDIRAKVRWGVVFVIILLVVSTVFDIPIFVNKGIDTVNAYVALGIPRVPESPFHLGLDLQGGTQLIYRTIVTGVPLPDRAAAVEGARDIIERRVNGLGVSEANIQTTKVGDDYRLNVELPGVTDVEQAVAMIGETPILEFREENPEAPRSLTTEEEKQLDKTNVEAKSKAEIVLKQVLAGKSFADAVSEFSDDEQSKNNGGYFGYIGENTSFGGQLYTWLSSAKNGDISPRVIETPDGYNIVRRGEERSSGIKARASHILVCYLGASRCDSAIYTKEEAKQKVEDLYDKANADNFADLAKEFSSDAGSKSQGGDLGFFGKGAMVPAFEQAVFSAKSGEIIGPVETEFGFHVIYKTGEQEAKEYEFSRIRIRTQSEADIVPPVDPWKVTGLSGKQLERSEVVSDPNTGAVQVSLQFTSEGKDLFRDITERNVGKSVAIFLDGVPISIPTVNQPILDGRAVISGQFDLREAKLLAQRLNAGALPVPVELISQQHIGATLGAESLAKSLKAGIIALAIILLFMAFYYRVPGLLAGIALLVYVATALAIFKLFGIALSLAGIAGFIMSIGVAVDANVLIFERLREELQAGKRLSTATEEAFVRALPSIRDSNVSTLITCVLLMTMGSSFVKGFAVTLSIGILVSLFSAIVVTRILMRFVIPWFPEFGNRLFLGSKHK